MDRSCHLNNIFLYFIFLMLTACGGGGGGGNDSNPPTTPDTLPDTLPDIFTFADQTDVTRSTVITSDSIIVTGIDAATTISVTDGEYSIDGGAFTSTEGVVTNGQSVRVRHMSSSISSTITTTLLSIGGVNGTFTSTTTTRPIITGFNQARSFNGTVNSVSPAIDGSGDLYVGGGFTTYNSTVSNRLIRLNSDGTVDALFDVGSGLDGKVNSISPATDGSGDLYVGGGFSTYNGTESNRLVRLNSDGTVDAAFNVGSGFSGGADSNGVDISEYEIIEVATISPTRDGSGDIYVGGRFGTYNGTRCNGMIRLNSDGTVDTEFYFARTGYPFEDFGIENNNFVRSISLANDGSGDLYVGGSVGVVHFESVSLAKFATWSGLLRLKSDGTVDSTFIGESTGFRCSYSSLRSISPATDGSGDLYVGGDFSSYKGTSINGLIRLNSDSTMDDSFNVGSGFDKQVNSISPATDGSGDIYVGGEFTTYNGTSSNGLIRLNNDGTVDTAFNIGSGFSGENDYGYDGIEIISPATDGSGDIYVGGWFSAYNGIGSNKLIRLNSDGTSDATFNYEGSGFDGAVKSISPATDGSGDLYVGGEFTTYNGTSSNGLIRLNSDGTVDAAFNVGDGFSLYSWGGVKCISPAIDGSGDLYVGGDFTSYNGTNSAGLIRLKSDGTVDDSFHVGSGFNDTVNSVSPATDGSGDLYVGGEFTAYNGISSKGLVRLKWNGTIDTAFNVSGRVRIVSPAIDGSGDLYVGGYFSTFNGTGSAGLIRLNSDRRVDASFYVDGRFSDFSVYSISQATDGSGALYVGGYFEVPDTTTNLNVYRLIRLDSNGRVDDSFNVGSSFDDSGFDGWVKSVSLATDGSGDLYVGGRFTTYNGTDSKGLIRLNSDGSVDAAFDVGDGFAFSYREGVNCISPATDGSGGLYVGGEFINYQSTTAEGIVLLNPNGSLN
jgi:uncharacterized delta-60 repeat protein